MQIRSGTIFFPWYSVYMQVVLVPRTRIFLAERYEEHSTRKILELGTNKTKMTADRSMSYLNL